MDPRELLRDYLLEHDEKPSAFAARIEYDKGNFHRILFGTKGRDHAWPTLDLALKIEQATDGRVPMSAWALAKAA